MGTGSCPLRRSEEDRESDPLNSKANPSVKDTWSRRTYPYNSSPQVELKEHRPQSRIKLVVKSGATMRNENVSRSSECKADRSNAELNDPHKLRTCIQLSQEWLTLWKDRGGEGRNSGFWKAVFNLDSGESCLVPAAMNIPLF